MSKLPNAPLLEVLFELRWNNDSAGKVQNDKHTYLYGDLYEVVKEKFPFRQPLMDRDIPKELIVGVPAHRYRAGKDDYPLVQIGNGIFTYNVNDEKYFWEDFKKDTAWLTKEFLKLNDTSSKTKYRLRLHYIDFYKFNFEKDDVNDFLNHNFNLNLEQKFFKSTSTPKDLNHNFYLNSDGLADILVNIKKGKNLKHENGVTMHTTLTSEELFNKHYRIDKWLEDAHSCTATIFRNIVTEKFYNTFK